MVDQHKRVQALVNITGNSVIQKVSQAENYDENFYIIPVIVHSQVLHRVHVKECHKECTETVNYRDTSIDNIIKSPLL